MRPLAELDLGHELRLDPHDVPALDAGIFGADGNGGSARSSGRSFSSRC
jgi:hypothetical protein